MITSKRRGKAFTIVELLVVIAILVIIAVIAVPNFMGTIEKSRQSQELAEIDSVKKAVNMFYSEHGYVPTLQGENPTYGNPTNIKFSLLVPDYLNKLPHFSYWYVDVDKNVFHTKHPIGNRSGTSLVTSQEYTYQVYVNGVLQNTTPGSTIELTDSMVVKITDSKGNKLPDITKEFKGTMEHPESPKSESEPPIKDVEIPVEGLEISGEKTQLTVGDTLQLTVAVKPENATNKEVIWVSSNNSIATVVNGIVEAKAEGNVAITCTSGTKSATYNIEVKKPIIPFGTVVNSLSSMQIGDRIPCRYYTGGAGSAGLFGDLGTCSMADISNGASVPNGKFYFIKVDRGLLIADRVIQSNISWNTLNNAGYIAGVHYIKTETSEPVAYKSYKPNPDIEIYRTSTGSLGSSIASTTEFRVLAPRGTWMGSNITMIGDKYAIIATGKAEIEYEEYLTGFYRTAPNNFLQLVSPGLINNRDDRYGISNYGASSGGVALFWNQMEQPAINQWHHVKAVLDFTAKQCDIYIDGILTGNVLLSTIISGGKYNIQLGAGTFDYTLSNRYKNITIKNDGEQAILVTLGDAEYDIRSLSGGTTFIDASGNKSNADQSLGAYPLTNEWDKYIAKSTLGDRITAGDNNIWNLSNFYSICQETIAEGFMGRTGLSTYRTIRGLSTHGMDMQVYNSAAANAGFRPVLQFNE